MTTPRTITGLTVAAVLVLSLVIGRPSAARADDAEQRAVDRAHEFLEPAKRGRDVLSYLHFGARYRGHEYVDTVAVKDSDGKRLAGHFALVYRFKWEDDGRTDVAFLCNAKGRVYEVQVVDTNAVLSQPFVLADASIKIIGNVLIEAYKDKLSDDDRKALQKLVDDADSHALLEWSLKVQQALGQ